MAEDFYDDAVRSKQKSKKLKWVILSLLLLLIVVPFSILAFSGKVNAVADVISGNMTVEEFAVAMVGDRNESNEWLFAFLNIDPSQPEPVLVTDSDDTPEPTAPVEWDADALIGEVTTDTEELQEAVDAAVAAGMTTISMNRCPVFENGTSTGDLLIYNSSTNKLPQFVEIYLKSTLEKVYSSGMIAVGSRIESAQLTTNLPKGTYDCVAYFNNIDPDTGTVLGRAGAEITVTILN